jgi:hypothetical protein
MKQYDVRARTLDCVMDVNVIAPKVHGPDCIPFFRAMKASGQGSRFIMYVPELLEVNGCAFL